MAVGIVASPDHFELERQGQLKQVLVAIRYIGDSRRYSNRSVASQGLWPEYRSFRQGAWHVGFVPETVPPGISAAGVAWFERNGNFEVEYDPGAIARVLLNGNYIDMTPAGAIGERDSLPDFDERVEEELGLRPEHVAGKTHREQLKEMAGLSEDDLTADEDVDPVNDLVSQFTRGELKEAVKLVREDTSHFNLRGKSMEGMAGFLVDEVDDPEHVVREANV